ncbi:MAG TPA: sigma-70 family RNA polymerase sigma factor [Candidatus Limnocylindria bacterium]|nr:sigma-70 family RNA polymerase sigma factor [Candidatus Limnocylindria bacterium]
MNGDVTLPARATLAAVIADDEAFRAWYDAVLPRVYRYLAARCGGDESLAEELTQQTFVEAVRHAHRFDGRSDVVTWLCSIARHRLVDHWRRRGRDDRRHLRLVDEHRDRADAPWHGSDARDAVESAVAALPADQRLALLFRYLDGMSVREVAVAIGRSEKATESLLARAREGFRRAHGGQTHA